MEVSRWPARAAATLLVTSAAVLVAAEGAHWRASRRAPDGRRCPEPVAVVVPGYRPRRGDGPHPLQQWRVDIGVRTRWKHRAAILVLTGGPTQTSTEARVMADLARAAGVPEDDLVLEERARTTWENVSRTTELVAAFPSVAIASDPLHAARARGYMARQRPDLAARLVAADDYRLLERAWLKIATAGYELLLQLRR